MVGMDLITANQVREICFCQNPTLNASFSPVDSQMCIS